jgi:hypothetical protein
MPKPGPQRPCLRVVCLILLAPLFALVACGPIGSTLEEDTPLAGAGNLKDSALVVTVSRVVDGDTAEVPPRGGRPHGGAPDKGRHSRNLASHQPGAPSLKM